MFNNKYKEMIRQGCRDGDVYVTVPPQIDSEIFCSTFDWLPEISQSYAEVENTFTIFPSFRIAAKSRSSMLKSKFLNACHENLPNCDE